MTQSTRLAALVAGLAALALPAPALASGGSLGCDKTHMSVAGMERTAEGDVIPPNFISSKIPGAWGRGATGEGVTVVVADTGISSEQEQLGDVFEPDKANPGRSLDYIEAGVGTGDVCGHGTRAAGTIAAPKDGANIVGVAWRSNLVSVKVGDDVVLDPGAARALSVGLRRSIIHRARPRPGVSGVGTERVVVSMALGDFPLFGIGGDYALLRDTIQELHRNYDVLFVGAAGTGVCANDATVAFPARLPEVMAVTAARDDYTVHSTACGGPEVALAVQLPDCPWWDGDLCKSVPTTGMNDDDILTFGGSSDATSVMAGIAALVWSQHPEWNRDQVRERLIESGSRPERDRLLGAGLIDAFKAAGGFVRLFVSPLDPVEPYSTFRLTAKTRGDGPFRYQWNTGETTETIVRRAGAAGTTQLASVTVTDVRDGTTKTSWVNVGPPAPPPEIDPICDRFPWKCE